MADEQQREQQQEEQQYTLQEVSLHSTRDDGWIVVDGVVYDISDLLEDETNHPGGLTLILPELGTDVSTLFVDAGVHAHSPAAADQLALYRIGTLAV
ncbi:cytochrome b5-like heme/steroid binding domain-containing protein [Entophlyctis helioformis]|nr:cytochrome b5-like heme/steroid binding domain-containing protein [Entophlyctis helioformis]